MSEKSTTTDSPGRTTSERQRLDGDRRRLVLDSRGEGYPVDLDEMAEGVAAREEGIGAVDEETVERVASTLHHTYLPKLAEAGALDYDPESQRIVAEQISYSTGPVPTSLVPDDWFHTHQLRRPDLEFLARTNQTNLEGLDGDENLFSRP